MVFCVKHPEREADFHCGHCEEGWCAECVITKRMGGGRIHLCRVCKNPVTELAQYRPVEPFWRRLPHFFIFPFSREGWMLFAIWPVMALCLRAMALAGVGILPPLPLYIYGLYFSLLATMSSKLTSLAEGGRMEMPASLEYDNFIQSIFRPVWNFLGAIVSSFWFMVIAPALVFILVRMDVNAGIRVLTSAPMKVIHVVVFLFGLFLLPISLLVLGVTENLKNVQNPLFLVRQARKVPREYGIMLLFFYSALGAYFGIRFLLVRFIFNSSILGTVVYFLVDSELHLYLFLFFGHLLGYMAYQTRYKFGWWHDTRREPVFKVRGQEFKLSWKYEPPPGGVPAVGKGPGKIGVQAAAWTPVKKLDLEQEEKLRERVKQAAYLYEHGSDDQASVLFREVLEQEPENFEALRGMVMTAYRLEDYDTVKRYARLVAEALAQERALEALWDMYQDYQKDMPDFSLNPPELFALSDWLVSEGKHLEAGRILRELAVSYPDHPQAAEALYRCGELLLTCGKPDNAKNVFAGLLKRHPESEFAGKAREALERMKMEEEGGKVRSVIR
jgi:hypothetical protein